MPLVIAVFLGLSALIVVCYPLFGLEATPEAPERADPLAEMADRETQAKRALREVDFDHRLGNLEDADYETLRDRYEQRALEALRARYEREQELDARIERELAALRSAQTGSRSAKNRTKTPEAMAGLLRPDRSRVDAAHEPRPRRRRGV